MLSVGQCGGGWATWRWLERRARWRVGAFAGYLALISVLFAQPLTRLMRYAAGSDFHSYILLVPFIAGYLLYIKRGQLLSPYRSSVSAAVTMSAIAIAAVTAGFGWHGDLSVNDRFSLMALAFVSLVAAGGFLFFGAKWMAAKAFPMTFLVFIVPLPDAAKKCLEEALVVASAEVADLLFNMSGTPQARQGTVFELPGIVLRVALECSGIHSSWVLFISSVLAAQVLLKTSWRKIALVAFVIPLSILRNGFRILIIGLLCVHVGPQMIDSSIHHRGGPLFFALSLVPLGLLLWWLRRREMRRKIRA